MHPPAAPRYRAVCRTDEVQPGRGTLVEVDGKEVAVFLVEGTLHAIENTCLHAGGPLHEGTITGTIVTCPWHGWQFDVRDGSCNLNPCVSLHCYDVREREGRIEIAAPRR
ncbi:MAG: Rieske (2Fe-2S) protein [Planctomycetota bacterium]|nr:Rieske (2Fe-2S) protein [Planctomycetota bacterium]